MRTAETEAAIAAASRERLARDLDTGPPDAPVDERQQLDAFTARRRRKTAPRIHRGVVVASAGPSRELRMLFLELWSIRDTKPEKGTHKGSGIVEVPQAELMTLLNWKDSARRFRYVIAEGAGWGMWRNDWGIHKASRLYLYPPDRWRAEWRAEAAKLPPRAGADAPPRPGDGYTGDGNPPSG